MDLDIVGLDIDAIAGDGERAIAGAAVDRATWPRWTPSSWGSAPR